MRTKLCRLLVLLLGLCLVCGCALAVTGDINNDDVADAMDAELLRMYLVGDLEEIGEADFNFDGKVNLKDLVLLEKAIYDEIPLAESPSEDGRISRTDVVYGTTPKKRDLVCTIIEPERYDRTVLCVFAMHGFEGAWDRDGQLLVYMANRVIEHFETANTMGGTRLMVVAAANPDGVWEGNSAEAFGRGNIRGIDMDADFGEAHVNSRTRGHYSRSAYSAPESAALRDLVLKYKPDVVLDFHGWSDETSGDAWLADVFAQEMSKVHVANFDTKTMAGSFTLWTHAQGCDTLKVHLKTTEAESDTFITAMERIVYHDYDDDGVGEYEYEPALAGLPEYSAYADHYRRLNMYSEANGRRIGYINALEDLCTIEAVYTNGWMRIRYPIKEGWKIGYCVTENFFVPDTVIYPIQMTLKNSVRIFTKNKFLTPEYKSRQAIERDANGKYIIDPSTKRYLRMVDENEEPVKVSGKSMGGLAKGRTVTVVAEADTAYQVIYPWKDEGYRMGWIENDQDLPEIPRGAERRAETTIDDEEEGFEELVPEMEAQALTGALSVEGLRINVGEEFDLPIYLDTDKISSLLLTVEFSPDVFDLLSVFDGGQLEGFTGSMDLESGAYHCLWNNRGDKAVHGLLVNLHFYTKPIGKDSQVRMSYKLRNGDALTYELDVVDVK